MSRIPDFPGESGPCSGSPDNSGTCDRHTLRPIERIVWVLSSHFTLARWFFRAQTVAELLSWDEVAYSMLSCWSPSSFRNVDQYDMENAQCRAKVNIAEEWPLYKFNPIKKYFFRTEKDNTVFGVYLALRKFLVLLEITFQMFCNLTADIKTHLSDSKVVASELRIVVGS